MSFLILLIYGHISMAQGHYGIAETEAWTGPKTDLIKRATVAIVKDEKFSAPTLFKLGEQYRFCTKENFEEQRLWANCSGTLIGKKTVLTAGHCVLSNPDCKKLQFIFGFNSDSDIEKIQTNYPQVFKCNKLLYTSKPVPGLQLKDYAIVELDRDVIGVDPISLSTFQDDLPDELFSPGHPLGLPKKVATGFRDSEDLKFKSSLFYRAHMLTHAGQSGAGVYDSNLNLMGILVRGDAAMEADDGRCFRVKTCDLQSCPWAEIQTLETENIKKYLK